MLPPFPPAATWSCSGLVRNPTDGSERTPSFGSAGTVIADLPQSDTATVPKLDATLTEADAGGRLWSTGSVGGSGRWRVYAGPANRLAGDTVVVAVPMTEVTEALQRLVFIEGSA